MALRYFSPFSNIRLSVTKVLKYDSITPFLSHKSYANNYSKLQGVAVRSCNRNVYTSAKILSEAQFQQRKYENMQTSKTQARGLVKYEDWESVLKQGEVEILEEEEGDTPYVVYLGVLSSQIRRVKLFSFATTAMGLCLQPVLFTQTDTSVAATAVAFTMIGFFTYVTPFLINLVSKRYVCEITYDPKTNSYTSSTYNFFLRKKQITFQTDHVEVPDVPGPFTSFIINTPDGRCTPLFVAPNTFTRPRHYAKLMGYDKPINLHLEDNEIEDKKTNDNRK